MNPDEKFEEIKKNVILEKDIDITRHNVTPVVIRAYCPKCGKEIVSNSPTLYNPFSLEKVNMYKCDCGFEGNLEYAYPRVVFVDENNNDINAYCK